ncbi:MAG TPA: peptidoglycan-binding domain-containing protein [Candidatus Tectomicrobia bacterium]
MCLRVGTLVTVLVLCLVMTALAQPTTDKARQERAEWETALEQLKRDKPKEYDDTKRTATLAAQVLLGRLGYGLGPYTGVLDATTTAALRAYQQHRHLPVTGDPLSFETFEHIQQDMDVLDYEPVGLPPLTVFLSFWDAGHVSGKGTWVVTNGEMAQPEQATDIQCSREQRRCTEATALVTGQGGKRILAVDMKEYEIARWDSHEVVTTPREMAGGCMRYVLTFNRAQQSVTGQRSPISTTGECVGMEAKELHMRLSNGITVYVERFKRSKQAARALMRFTPELIEFMDRPGK